MNTEIIRRSGQRSILQSSRSERRYSAGQLFLIIVLILCPALLLSRQPAYAGEPTDQLKQSVDAVIETLKNKELKRPGKEAERRAELRKIIYARFDFHEMAKRALALNWRKRTPEEQKDFVPLFADLLESTYLKKIERYHNERVVYGAESVDDGYATVKTKIITRENTEVPVDYRLMKEDAKWLVYDVTIEGVSLVANYRTQFNEIIRSGSYQDLVNRLKKKQIKEPR